MGPLVFGVSFIILTSGFIVLLINLFKKKRSTLAKSLLITGAVLFVISLLLPGPSKEDSVSPNQQVKDKEEELEETNKQKAEVNEDKLESETRKPEQQEEKEITQEQQPEVTDSVENGDDKKSEVNEESDALLKTAQVTRVVDGDTVEIKWNGRIEDVRLLLVDTPETVHPSKPVQPYGPEASSFAKEILTGKQVQVEFDGPKRDKYDRLLAYLWVDGKMFNEMLLEEGLARLAYVYDPPYTHFDAYVKAQTKAVNSKKGIWSRSGYVTEDGFQHEESQQTKKEDSTNNANAEQKETSNSSSLRFDPNGPDRDCGDFDTFKEAQNFYEAAGGPSEDPHRLDRDGNSLACESLP